MFLINTFVVGTEFIFMFKISRLYTLVSWWAKVCLFMSYFGASFLPTNSWEMPAIFKSNKM